MFYAYWAGLITGIALGGTIAHVDPMETGPLLVCLFIGLIGTALVCRGWVPK